MRAIQAAGVMALSVLFAIGAAMAQSSSQFTTRISQYSDLSFPPEATTLGLFSRVSNAIFKPEGDGPFPAIVLTHTCGGIQPHISDRAKELIAAGFVVLVQDSYGPRGHTTFCTAAGVGAPRVYKDSFDALKHLSQLNVVDPSRIYLVGLSLGSFAAAAVSSPEVARWIGTQDRFRASVGWYGACTFNVGPYPKWELIRHDVDRPVLLLMAKNDIETPIADCFPLLENLKAEGKPVAWHVYDDATHGWDKSDQRRGYRYNAAVTADAMKRTIEFLKQN
jgi:dienelactone hydrolase